MPAPKSLEKRKLWLDKLSKSCKGRIAWNKGTKGVMKSNKTSFKKGQPSIFEGKYHTEESKEKNRLAHLGKPNSSKTKFKKGMPSWNKGLEGQLSPMKGKHHTKEANRKNREAHMGSKNVRWRNGKSFEPYTIEFNRQLKELIRQRDNYQCQKCGCSERENISKLSIHHIDYIKKNCLPTNLTSLCRSCNIKVNSNREYWTNYFRKRYLYKTK